MEGNQQFDVAFVRHAESEMNKATQQYVNRNNIPYDWDHLSKNHEFLETIKYGFSLWDASITELGREQVLLILCSAKQPKISWLSSNQI